MTINRDRLFRTITTLDIFVNHCLDLRPKGPFLSGFEYNRDLLKAAMANTYIETVGSKADSVHLAIKNVQSSNFYWEYLRTLKILGERFKLDEQDVVLAFDYTDEDFYGEVQGFWIHGWTGKDAVMGKFKFLTCALVSSDIPQKIPLISIPICLGHNQRRYAFASLLSSRWSDQSNSSSSIGDSTAKNSCGPSLMPLIPI